MKKRSASQQDTADRATKKLKKHEDCACIFCKSKCPECGSVDVKVRFKPEYRYKNNQEDLIRIQLVAHRAELDCNECGKYFETHDAHMAPLARVIAKVLDFNVLYEVPISKNMKISTKIYRAPESKRR